MKEKYMKNQGTEKLLTALSAQPPSFKTFYAR